MTINWSWRVVQSIHHGSMAWFVSSAANRSIGSTTGCTITEKAPTRAFSWLKAPTSAFTFKTLLRHYAKWALTPRSLNVKLGPLRNYHKGRAQGYLFCSFAEFFNSAKNSQDCEKWKKTTKFTRILSRFWVSPRNSSMGQNLQKWASISQNGSKWATFSEIHNTIGTNSSQWALICSKWV